MTKYTESAIERSVERCKNREGMGADDADAILEVHRELELLGRSEVSASHHSDVLMRACKIATEVGGLAAALEDRDAAEAIVRWINRTYDNPETNKGYRTSFRAFARHATDGDELPESVAWVPGGYPSNYDPAPDSSKMFEWAPHVKPMLEVCQNVRDEALIALSWDLGPRTSELHALSVANVATSDYGMEVTIENGKTGTRTPTIVRAVPFVRDWLERHPGSGEDPLWSRLDRPDRVSENYLRDILVNAADRADITPPSKPTPTRMRKSSASYLAKQGVNQPYLEDHHGWVRGSDQAARYIATFDDAGDRAIAEAHGVDVEPADDEPAYRECTLCGLENPVERDVCRRCRQPLSQRGAELADELQRTRAQALAAADPDTYDDVVESTERLSDPGHEDELRRLRRRVDELEGQLEDSHSSTSSSS